MNENWRILMALGLTIIVLMGWNFLFPQKETPKTEKETPKVSQDLKQKDTPQEPPGSQKETSLSHQSSKSAHQAQKEQQKEIASSGFQSDSSKTITIDTPLYKAVLNSKGGILEHFWLKNYKKTIQKNSEPIDLISPKTLSKAPLGILWNQFPTWKDVSWKVKGNDINLEDKETGKLVFQGEIQPGIFLTRTLSFQADNYQIKEDLQIINKTGQPQNPNIALTLASKKLVTDKTRYNKTNMIYLVQNSLNKEDDLDDLSTGIHPANKVQWAGIDSNYFLLATVPINRDMRMKGKFEDGVYRLALESNISLSVGEDKSFSSIYYLGPKLIEYLESVPKNLKASIHYGFLDIIAKPLVKILNFFNTYVHNFGIAIILLTVVIKIVFWPLSYKSFKSMEQMKKIQPMMKKLKEQYKDDKQKMNQELMRLYKTYKVNPAGGCLPMLLQIPVFIGLYEALLGSIQLRHATFISNVPFTDIVWLADLAAKDPLYVTPVLMGLTMYLQQKLSPQAGDPTQAKIMMFMPIVLTFIFLNFPAGLVVYFITNNVLSIAQQGFMLRKK